MIFRPRLSPSFYEKSHVPADIYVVEISSGKHLTISDVPIQMNYTYRHFGDFFADKSRTRAFWSMSTPERFSERREWLANHLAFQRLSEADQDLLSQIRMQELGETEIAQDMTEIVERLGSAKVVFVTHVNAHTPDDKPIESRNRLINLVRTIAGRLGVSCYDPTPLMREIGQLHAMEHDGLDLTHYTPAFADRLCADWHKRFFVPVIAAAADDLAPSMPLAENVALDELAATWGKGDVIAASRGLRSALRTDPSLHEHRRLLGRIQFETADYEGTLKSLELARAELGPNEDDDLLLMRSNFEIGEFNAALNYGRSLLSDEVETSDILRVCAISAARIGEDEEALTHWRRLFHKGEHEAEAASAVLQILKKGGEADAAVVWSEQVMLALPSHKDSFLTLWNDRLETGDRADLLELASLSRMLTDEEALELAERSSALGFATPASILIAARNFFASENHRLAEWAAERATDWLKQGTKLLEQGALFRAGDYLQASWRLRSGGNVLIRARRTLEQSFRKEVRQAFLGKDFAKVMELTAGALQTGTEFPELDNFRGRAAAETGDFETALLHLKKAVEEGDASLGAKVQFARVATKAEQYLEALSGYQAVLESDRSEDWATQEAERHLVSLTSRAIKAARHLAAASDHEAAWKLLEQVRRHEPSTSLAEREQTRMLTALRKHASGLDPSDSASKLHAGETILRLVPTDEIGLKTAGIGAMRLHRFREALGYWMRLRDISQKTDQIDSNIQKCKLWIERLQKKAA